MRTIFIEPDGTVVEDPTVEFLSDKIICESAEYWHYDAQEAVITIENGKSKTLAVRCAEKAELFHLAYTDDADGLTYFAFKGDDFDSVIRVPSGGNSYILPSALFLNSQLTCKIVVDFVRAGIRSNDCEWILRAKMPWNRTTVLYEKLENEELPEGDKMGRIGQD